MKVNIHFRVSDGAHYIERIKRVGMRGLKNRYYDTLCRNHMFKECLVDVENEETGEVLESAEWLLNPFASMCIYKGFVPVEMTRFDRNGTAN